tara:strand:- start:1168 stop:1653 length:486 start_codon:yes stop_codon:yes gene_type:complete
MDPLTISVAVGVASKAFQAIKQGISVGNDIQDMTKSVSSWMKAVSDVDNAQKQAKNPPLFKKLLYASSIEQDALEAFAAKKKLQEQREELKAWLNLTYGPDTWSELLALEGQIRKQRQQEVYDQQKFRDQILNYVAIAFLCIVIVMFVGLMLYLVKQKYGW